MSLKNEIEIDYLDRKTKVSLPKEYADFIKLCKETFYLSESRSKDMSIIYIDEDDDEVPIDEDEYNNEKARKASFWTLNLNEDEEDLDDIKHIKNELTLKKNDLLNKAKIFKAQLLKKCNGIIESEVKKRNDLHKENIKKIKKAYEDNLNGFKQEINDIIKESLQTITQNVMSIYNDNIDIIDNEIKESLKGNISTLQNECEEEFNKIKVDEIGEQMDNIKNNVKQCQSDFLDLYRQSQNLNTLCEITKEIKKQCKISKKGVTFNLDVLNKTKKKLTGKYILHIIGTEGNNEKFQLDLDLSDVDSGMKKAKEITIKPKIRKEGKYIFRLFIKEDNNVISNESELILEMVDLGSMNDVMGVQ